MFHASAGSKPLALPGPVGFVLRILAIATYVGLYHAISRYRLLPTVLVGSIVVQVGAVIGVPIFVLIMRKFGPQKEEKPFQREPISFAWLPSPITVCAFFILAGGAWLLTYMISELSIWKLSSVFQLIAYAFLVLKVAVTKKPTGISAQKLILDAVLLFCRLVATYLLDRRLPRKSGCGLVMCVDALCLSAALGLLYCVRVRLRNMYQADMDSFGIRFALVGCFMLAAVLRATVGDRFFADFLWTAALYLDVVAMIPQLWMVAQNGGVVEEATSHHMAAMFISRLLGVVFWWVIRRTWLQGMKLPGWIIFAAHAAQLVVLSRFMSFYFRGCFERGPLSSVPLVCAEG